LFGRLNKHKLCNYIKAPSLMIIQSCIVCVQSRLLFLHIILCIHFPIEAPVKLHVSLQWW
jgi:hypothetical protein